MTKEQKLELLSLIGDYATTNRLYKVAEFEQQDELVKRWDDSRTEQFAKIVSLIQQA